MRIEISVEEIKEFVKWFEEMETKEKVESNSGKFDDTTVSNYARYFDEGSAAWTKDPEYNLTFLKSQENYFNDKLKAEGFLFLNDVYSGLGLPKSSIGQAVGWVYDEQNPLGDNFVSFGIYHPINSNSISGLSKIFLLDFNVDGEILSRI